MKSHKRFVLAAVQLAILGSLGVNFLLDRAIQPRVWVKTVPIDPTPQFIGRYLLLRIEVDAPPDLVNTDVSLIVQGERLIAISTATGIYLRRDRTLEDPLKFFLPAREKNAWQHATDAELWAEVAVPKRGAPRPIRLGLKKNGVVMPL